ncbi:MAG TPA: sensor histidine kinase, partial [Candidatus Nocardiopsis merdipullorum]|nr:sensor histidine kinase [Candidatus Nocardiopsis merdipullorum]
MNTSARATRAPEARLRALTDPRYLLTSWPWEGLAHILSGTVVAGVLFSVAAPLFLPWMLSLGLAVTRPDNHLVLIGVLVLVGVLLTALFGPLVGIPSGIVERWRLRLLRDKMPAGGHRSPTEPGLGPWLCTRYGESATWREVA